MKGTRGGAAFIALLACGLGSVRSSGQDDPDPKRVRAGLVDEGGGSDETEAAVHSGLAWLARHQSRNGGWGTQTFSDQCQGEKKCQGEGISDFDTGVTGLALLAFLQAGYVPQDGEADYGVVVSSGLSYLVKAQNKDGSIGPKVAEMMYNHALATRALCEALARTNDQETWKAPAKKAVDFLIEAQNYPLGWRYTPKCGQNDTSVTGMCVLALKSARRAKLRVPGHCFDWSLAWFKRVTDQNGQVGYDRLGSGEIYVPGKNESWAHHQTMTAVAMLCRILIEKDEDDPEHEKAAKIVAADLPSWDSSVERPPMDAYYWYYGTYALFQYPGPEKKKWKRWNDALKTALVDHQRKKGCRAGSWDTEGVDRWAYAGGRVYETALNVLTLEVYYAYPRVLDKE